MRRGRGGGHGGIEDYDPMNPHFGGRGGRGKFMPKMTSEYRQNL